MATRAEKFRAETERSAQQAKTQRRTNSAIEQDRADAQAERVALVEREDGKTIVPRNVAPRAGADSTYQLEATDSGRPSRKSTRMIHVKVDGGLRTRTMQAQSAPSTRSERRT